MGLPVLKEERRVHAYVVACPLCRTRIVEQPKHGEDVVIVPESMKCKRCNTKLHLSAKNLLIEYVYDVVVARDNGD